MRKVFASSQREVTAKLAGGVKLFFRYVLMQKKFKVENTDNIIHIEIADTFFKRFLGLMGRRKLSPSDGLLITPCNSVHMMFMRFSIDVIYLDKDMKVLKIAKNLIPWIGLSAYLKAKSAVEVTAGVADRLGIYEGVRLVEV